MSADTVTKRFVVRRSWAELARHPFRRSFATVLEDITFDVAAGEFFGILGPNGAGKTTLFKILMASLSVDQGEATVLGHDTATDGATVRRLVGCVMANDRSLYWRLTAVENLRLYAALHGIDHGAERERIAEVLAAVELDDTREKLVGAFSSGMKQRLLIARALLPRPKILLLDEPTRSLDPLSARQFRQFLKTEVVGRQHCTVLLATHSSEEAMELCDRVAILDKGRLLAVGTTDAIASTYSERTFRVWTRTPAHPAFAQLQERNRLGSIVVSPAEDSKWWVVQMSIPGGPEEAAGVMDVLTTAGVRIARFERVSLTLPELLERVMARGRIS